jgi:hypothetical protein
MKAKYIGKWTDTSYGQCMIYLEYEYRGHRYTVYENRCKGNIPLSWQHKNEQISIDALIEREAKPQTSAKPIDWDEIWAMMEWD